MKKAFFALLLAFGGTLAVQAEVNPKPFVVPELTSWQGAEGRFVPSGRIVVPSNKSLRVVAERFAADYATMFGRKLTLVSGDAQAGDFVFSLQKDVAERPLGKEGNAHPPATQRTKPQPHPTLRHHYRHPRLCPARIYD